MYESAGARLQSMMLWEGKFGLAQQHHHNFYSESHDDAAVLLCVTLIVNVFWSDDDVDDADADAMGRATLKFYFYARTISLVTVCSSKLSSLASSRTLHIW